MAILILHKINQLFAMQIAVCIKSLIKTGNATLGGTKEFADTKGHWAQAYIATAVEMGIVGGRSDTQFGPDDPITRQEMAVMISKAMKLTQGSKTFAAADEDQKSAWTIDSVKLVCSNGIMSATDGKFRATDNTTRPEAAAVIFRSLIEKGYVTND